jgi:hypothetical protein
MAEEATKFPGTELSLVEVVEKSWRLDHPNFGDVCKTTFAKGVIKDFSKIQDDPMKVKPLVKVEVEGVGESDFIPIFFHPKAQYWDEKQLWGDPGEALAQDIDKDNGYFKQSWMSFRGGDEVAVMLKEGVPVAVVGFADGVPRLGEDILKVDVGQGFFLCAQTREKYDAGESGPDGAPLKLLKECEVIGAGTELVGEYDAGGQITNLWGGDFGSYEVEHHEAGWIIYMPVPAYDSLVVYQNARRSTSYADSHVSTYKDKYYYLVPIGPFLFWINARRTRTEVKYTERTEYDNSKNHPFGKECTCLTYADFRGWGLSEVDVPHPECYVWAEAEARALDASWDEGPGMPDDYDIVYCYLDDTYVALYTEELFQRAKDAGSWENRPAEFVEQNEAPFWWSSALNAAIKNMADIEFSMFARPHTKAELQDAGMWPKG